MRYVTAAMRALSRAGVFRFLLFSIQPFRSDLATADRGTIAAAIGEFFLSGTPAFFIWKVADAGSNLVDLLMRFLEVSAVLLVFGMIWAGLRLQQAVDRYRTPKLTLKHDPTCVTCHEGSSNGTREHFRVEVWNQTGRPLAGDVHLVDISPRRVEEPVHSGALHVVAEPAVRNSVTADPPVYLIAAVGTTVQPAYASLWLKRASRSARS